MVLVVLVAAATLAMQAGWPCVDCGLEKTDVRLCTLHAEAERAAFAEAKKPLTSRLEEERSAALEGLSRLTKSHINAPSERVARQLAKALRDEAPAVRELAVRLLGPPQHATIVMAALLEELSRAEKEQQRLFDDEQDMNRKRANGSLREKQAEALETALKGNAEAQEALVAWRLTLVNQLAHFLDDRVVDALCRSVTVEAPAKAPEYDGILANWVAHRESGRRLRHALDLSGTLVRLGNRAALRSVARTLTALVAEIATLEKDRSSSPRDLPRLREMLEAEHRVLSDARDRATQEIADALAGKRWSEEPPPERHGLPVLLAPWVERNLESIPEHLPGVISPAW